MGWVHAEESVYFILNAALRSKQRSLILPWFPYLRLLTHTLLQLTPYSSQVWRGVKEDLSNNYPVGKEFTWWGFTSCTTDIGVLENEQFCGKSGKRTAFCLTNHGGVAIQEYSGYTNESEVLLFPATSFKVKSKAEMGSGLTIITLDRIDRGGALIDYAPYQPSKSSETSYEDPAETTRLAKEQFEREEKQSNTGKSKLFGSSNTSNTSNTGKMVNVIGSYVGSISTALKNPYAFAGFHDVLYVCDSGNHRIRIYDTQNREASTIGEYGPTATEGKLSGPAYMYIYNSILYIANYGHSQVQRYNVSQHKWLSPFPTGTPPVGITVHNSLIYVGFYSANQIGVYNLEGSRIKLITTIRGNGNSKELYMPCQMAVAHEILYVADCSNDRIVALSLDGAFLFEFGTGKEKQKSGFMSPVEGTLSRPHGIYLHGDQLYVADQRYVRKFDLQGNCILKFGSPTIQHGVGVTIWNGMLYVADYAAHKVHYFK